MMAGFASFLRIFSWNSLILGQYILGGGREGRGVGWVVAKAQTKKKQDTNSIVQSSYDVYMHLQRANIPLKGLDRHALTVGAISDPHSQLAIGALLCTISPDVDLYGQQIKSIKGKQTS